MNQVQTRKWLKLSAVIFYVAMVTVNALANILPINGMNTGELSDMYPNLFTPIGLTFSIWGLIYLMLLLFVIYQLEISSKQAKVDTRVTVGFIISCLLNIAWIFLWHYQMVLFSVVIMICLLIVLIRLYLITRVKQDFVQKVCISAPFSLYLGWISVATIANISAYLVSIGFRGVIVSEMVWTIAVMAVAVLLGILNRKDYIYNGVIIWAFLGIYLRHAEGDYHTIATAAVVGIVLMLMGVLSKLLHTIVVKK